jgi:hypothetical protein
VPDVAENGQLAPQQRSVNEGGRAQRDAEREDRRADPAEKVEPGSVTRGHGHVAIVLPLEREVLPGATWRGARV